MPHDPHAPYDPHDPRDPHGDHDDLELYPRLPSLDDDRFDFLDPPRPSAYQEADPTASPPPVVRRLRLGGPLLGIDLSKIPRGLWHETLVPLSRQERAFVALDASDPTDLAAASGLAWQITQEEEAAASQKRKGRDRARRVAGRLPIPGTEHASTRPGVQVNVRLRSDDHARLAEAARGVGMRPTTLARALVLNGVTQVLRDLESL